MLSKKELMKKRKLIINKLGLICLYGFYSSMMAMIGALAVLTIFEKSPPVQLLFERTVLVLFFSTVFTGLGTIICSHKGK